MSFQLVRTPSETSLGSLALIERLSQNHEHARTTTTVLLVIFHELGYTFSPPTKEFNLSTDLIESFLLDDLHIESILIELGHEFGFSDFTYTEAIENGLSGFTIDGLVDFVHSQTRN